MDNETKFFSKKWKVKQTTVAKWCRDGLIPGATQDKPGSPWHTLQIAKNQGETNNEDSAETFS